MQSLKLIFKVENKVFQLAVQLHCPAYLARRAFFLAYAQGRLCELIPIADSVSEASCPTIYNMRVIKHVVLYCSPHVWTFKAS